MKLALEIVAIWTLLNFVVGIPLWMLVKLRDRREIAAQGPDGEDAYASDSTAGFSNPVLQIRAYRIPLCR